MVFKLVEKTKQLYVLPNLLECNSTIMSFDLWMSKGVHNIFSLVINFLEANWQAKHVTLGLFEDINISREDFGQKLD